eukprot:c14180_g1_i2 orf=213-3113(+)
MLQILQKTIPFATNCIGFSYEVIQVHVSISCGSSSIHAGPSHTPSLTERHGSYVKYHCELNHPFLHYDVRSRKTQSISSSNMGTQYFGPLYRICHTLCCHDNMEKVNLLPRYCVDSSKAEHSTFSKANCYGGIQNFGHSAAGYVDASEEPCCEVSSFTDNLWHGNFCNTNAISTHFEVNFKAHNSSANIYKASVMTIGESGEFVTRKHALSNPQEFFWNQVFESDSAGDQAGRSNSIAIHWEMLNLDDVTDLLSHLIDPPSIDDLICIIQICKRSKDLKYGKLLHAHICKFGLEAHRIAGNHLVQMFAECGCVSAAQQVLTRLMNHNVYTWTSLMSGFIQCGQAYHAIGMYEKMQEISLYPSKHTLVTLLKACARLKDLERGQQLYVCIVQRGCEMDLFVGSTLIDMYAKCGLLLDAEEVFDKLPIQNTVSWSALIAAYAEHEHAQEALNRFEQMQVEGISPDEVTFVPAMKSCGSLQAWEMALEIHSDIIQKGFEKGRIVANGLIDMHAKCGSLAEARDVLTKLAVLDAVSWTALISGYSEHGSNEELLLCFEKMQLEGVSPDAKTFASVLKACSSVGAIERGRKIQKIAQERQLDCELFVCSTLVDMYAKSGFLSEAQEAFDKLSTRDLVSWNALIAGYAEYGPCEEVLSCFERMHSDGIAQGTVTFLCAFKACGNMVAIDKGLELHTDSTLRGFDNDRSVGSTLVDMYAKLGLLSEAQDVFHKLHCQDVVSWNAIIKAHGINQAGGIAVQLFECMQKQGVKPDNVTFTCLLTACSRACLVQKGQQLFKAMTKDYGIPITRDSVVCIVDLLARSGKVEEAWKLLGTMPSSPSNEVLRSLLSACKTHTEQALGIVFYEQLVHLNPECAAPYLLMSDIYRRQGKWELAYKLEELRNNVRARKTPASAMIEVNRKVHKFLVGDTPCKEFAHFLEMLSLRVVTCGHVPDLDGVLRLIPYGAALCDFAP